MPDDVVQGTTETVENEPRVDDEPRIPKARLDKEAAKRRDAERRAQELEAKLQERETAGLPELEQWKKRAEQAEKRAQEAERVAEERERQITTARREQWVSQAAGDLGFVNPGLAARLVDDLDAIDSREAAERAVKRLAKSDPYLVRGEEKPLPGKVLEGGRAAEPARGDSIADRDREAAQGMLEEIQRIRANAWVGGQ